MALALALLFATATACQEPIGIQLFESPQSEPIVLSGDGSLVFVANTTSNSVEILDAASLESLATVRVGVDPVGLALRPGRPELWVTNHISDSVSVIDVDPASPTRFQVIRTIQQFGPRGETLFDEPVGIAFANSSKAYVTLSSRNQVAVIDADDYAPVSTLAISAQDPRALAVRNGYLYVAAFESGNQSNLSLCWPGSPLSSNCTLFPDQLRQHGVPMNVVIDPQLPDRDLFVIDTATDTIVDVVEHVGTLLYGMAISPAGSVYVTNTEARNHALDGNGLAAQPPLGLGQGVRDLENRPFRNRVTRIDCSAGACGVPVAVDLEPQPGNGVPAPLAVPYGAALSADGSLLLITAASSSRLASLDAATLAVLDALDVGAIPRGVAFHSTGSQGRAYVLNSLGNTVTAVDVGPGGSLSAVATVGVGSEITPDALKRGRIAFNDASASASGTFACASCHPDAHVDQLLWVIGATCSGCDQEEPRTTQPVRGLHGTLPLHWDGTLGDPFGGPDGANGTSAPMPPDCSLADGEETCFRHLVDASLAGVMCEPDCTTGPSGLPGQLDDARRDDLAQYLGSVSYPPARSRSITDAVSASALQGFSDFFLDHGGDGSAGGEAQTCADTTGGCHELPLLTGTKGPSVNHFDAPTLRGLNDRFIQFSLGETASGDFLRNIGSVDIGGPTGVIPWDPALGYDERVVFSAAFIAFQAVYQVFPDNIFEMVEEMSTGYSGAFGRHATLSAQTCDDEHILETALLLELLEKAARRGVVNLRGDGVRNSGTGFDKLQLGFVPSSGLYENQTLFLARHQLLADARAGNLVITFTANLRSYVGDPAYPRPLLATETDGAGQPNDPPLPMLLQNGPMVLEGTDVHDNSALLVDGELVDGTLSCVAGSFAPTCTSGAVEVSLDVLPPIGLHLLQIQSPKALLSNELPFCVGQVTDCL